MTLKTLHWLALVLLCVGGQPALAQEKTAPATKPAEDGFVPRIDLDGTPAATIPQAKSFEDFAASMKKPRISAEDLYRVKPTQSEEKLQAAIDSLYSIIDYADDEDPQKPGYLARLADLYWQKAESYFMSANSDEMDRKLNDARDSDNADRLLEAEDEKQRLLDMQVEWRQKAIKIYKELESKYPDYDKMDMVLFYLGNFLGQMQEAEGSYEYYVKLITRYPESKYLPDTLVNIGDYYFDQNDFGTAIQFYAKVGAFQESHIYGYAIYKLAWCHYNMAEYRDAFARFVEVIRYSDQMERRKQGVRIGLKTEAQKDLVLAYSQIGKETQAIPFFKEIASDIYLQLAAQLGDLYLDMGEPAKSMRMYKTIIRESLAANPDTSDILSYQRAIVNAVDRTVDKPATAKEVRRLVDLYRMFKDKKDPILEKEEARIEELLHRMAVNYHLEAQKIGDKATQVLAKELYDYYLTLFPDADGKYQMTMNLAILSYQSGDYRTAVQNYEQVITMQPDGKYAREAGYTALLAYYKLIDLTSGQVKEEDQGLDENRKKEMPELSAAMIKACDRFVDMKPEEEEDLIQARFAAARIFYQFNHFEDAIARFSAIIEAHPAHPFTPDAAKMLLSSFMMTRDIKNLNLWAEKLYRMPNLAQGELLGIINKIRDRAQFNRCFEYEFDRAYELAARCFQEYAQAFPQSTLLDKAYYNAALNFRRANLYLDALQANAGLYSCCSKTSDLGPRALFLIADTFRMAAVYDQAAVYFERYVKEHPKSEKTREALAYAARFRRSLGQYKEAMDDYNLYIKRFPKDPNVPAVYFDMGMMFKKQKDSAKATAHFNSYLKKYGDQGSVNLVLASYQEIGEALLGKKKRNEARKMFEKVIDTFKGLTPEKRKTVNSKGIFAIAWAFFNLGDDAYQEGVEVQLTRAKLKENTEKKIKAILSAEQYYTTVLALRHPYWSTAALFRIGFAWKSFASEFENSPLPPGLTPDEQEYYKLTLTEEAGKFRQKAASAFKKCIEEAVANKVFNEFTEKAEKELSELEFQFSGVKEYRVRPGFFASSSNPPGMVRPEKHLQSRGAEDEAKPAGGVK